MSNIGKLPVKIPDGVSCIYFEGVLNMKGCLGSLNIKISDKIKLNIDEEKIIVKPVFNDRKSIMLWGTTRKLISNLAKGVSIGFTKILNIHGVGYKAFINENKLILNLGFSHEIFFPIPKYIDIRCINSTTISVFGADIQKVGEIAAKIRSFRKPDSYKGKGIRYSNEFVIKKEIKKK